MTRDKGEGQHCVNMNGGFYCNCDIGFEGRDSNSDACFDIDECTKEVHNCDFSSTCTNTPGSFHCKCSIGFEVVRHKGS